MISRNLWNIGVIFGQIVFSVVVYIHVRLVPLPGNRNIIYRRCQAIKLIKAVIYTALIPLWWLIPMSYNNPIGNEREWVEYSGFVTYGDCAMGALVCVYVVELLYVSIPNVDISTFIHHVGTILVVCGLNSDLFVLWPFPVVLYGMYFLSATSTLQWVSYVYQLNRDPLMYKWYGRVRIWILICVLFFHTNYVRVLYNSIRQDTAVWLLVARFLLWGAYVTDHVPYIWKLNSIYNSLKDRSDRMKLETDLDPFVCMEEYESTTLKC
jgi:hypothetical protein